MPALARLQTADCANPVLDLYTSINGQLQDIAAASFQIWDKSQTVAVQVYPATAGARASIDVDVDCPDGQRLSTGRYVTTPWTVPADARIGTYEIRWFVQLTPSIAPQLYIEEFEVLPEVFASGFAPSVQESYLLVRDMRDEGVTDLQADDTLLARRIQLASRFIETATKRVFYPHAKTMILDGGGGSKLLLGEPIISLDAISIDSYGYGYGDFDILDRRTVRVFNRHLSGFLDPDDRDNPKIELYSDDGGWAYERAHHAFRYGQVFPRGVQNVQISGIFGYTDPDGTATGCTPELIKHACKLIVIRELGRIGRVDQRFDAQVRNRITGETTRDQSYTLTPLAAGRTGAFFSGDIEIDGILASFLRPPHMGAA